MPLLIRIPGYPENGTVRQDISQAIDIVPTLLQMAGSKPPDGLRGRDLLSGPKDGITVLQEGVLDMVSLRTADHRLLFRGPPLSYPDFGEALETAPLESPWFEFYDLRADPGEQHNIVDVQVNEQVQQVLLE